MIYVWLFFGRGDYLNLSTENLTALLGDIHIVKPAQGEPLTSRYTILIEVCKYFLLKM